MPATKANKELQSTEKLSIDRVTKLKPKKAKVEKAKKTTEEISSEKKKVINLKFQKPAEIELLQKVEQVAEIEKLTVQEALAQLLNKAFTEASSQDPAETLKAGEKLEAKFFELEQKFLLMEEKVQASLHASRLELFKQLQAFLDAQKGIVEATPPVLEAKEQRNWITSIFGK